MSSGEGSTGPTQHIRPAWSVCSWSVSGCAQRYSPAVRCIIMCSSAAPSPAVDSTQSSQLHGSCGPFLLCQTCECNGTQPERKTTSFVDSLRSTGRHAPISHTRLSAAPVGQPLTGAPARPALMSRRNGNEGGTPPRMPRGRCIPLGTCWFGAQGRVEDENKSRPRASLPSQRCTRRLEACSPCSERQTKRVNRMNRSGSLGRGRSGKDSKEHGRADDFSLAKIHADSNLPGVT
jgi:hypothetical protein